MLCSHATGVENLKIEYKNFSVSKNIMEDIFMKKILTCFLVLMIGTVLSAEKVLQYGTDTIILNTMQDMTPEMYDKIMNGDIFSIFNLTDYTTSLQKKKFLESAEGQYYSEQ